MISEGTDIPRLQVCCHLSRVKTELYFRQILGRILRMSHLPNQEAWLFTLAEEKLSAFASRIGEELPDMNILVKNKIITNNFSFNMKGAPGSSGSTKKISKGKIQFPNDLYISQNLNNPSNKRSSIACLDKFGGFRKKLIETFVFL